MGTFGWITLIALVALVAIMIYKQNKKVAGSRGAGVETQPAKEEKDIREGDQVN